MSYDKVTLKITIFSSKEFYDEFVNSINDMKCVDNMAESFGNYIKQACDRLFQKKPIVPKQDTRPHWFDRECRTYRNDAITASKSGDAGDTVIKCREYRACKQQKRPNPQQLAHA